MAKKQLIFLLILLLFLAGCYRDEDIILIDKSNDTFNPNINYLQFNTSYIHPIHSEGALHWNDADGTLELDMKGNNVHLQIGEEMLIRAKNDESFKILNGQLVYIFSGSGSNPTIKLANNSNYQKNYVIGMATENITNSQFGYVTTTGLVRDINTASYSAGTILYLTSIGGYTNIKPSYPEAIIIIGTVIRQHATEGVIYVRVDTIENTFGNNINNTHYEKDGTLVFLGNATVWDDTATSILSAKLPSVNPIVWKTWKGNLGTYAFEEKPSNADQSVEFAQQLSHRVKTGSNIACHLHYNVPTASTQNISFQLDYNCANISTTYYTNNKQINKTFTLQNIAYRQSIADFGNIACKGSISQIEKFYLKRLSAKDSYTNDVYVDYFDCHFEIDTVGSRSEYTK